MKGTYTINATMRNAYERYLRSNWCSLYDVYANPSIYKQSAFEDCICEMLKINGYDGRIISFNTNLFTFGFIGQEPTTGDKVFVWITRDKYRWCYVAALFDD